MHQDFSCFYSEIRLRHPRHGFVKYINEPALSFWYVYNGRTGGDARFLHSDGLWHNSLFDSNKRLVGSFPTQEAAQDTLDEYLHTPFNEGGPFPADPE